MAPSYRALTEIYTLRSLYFIIFRYITNDIKLSSNERVEMIRKFSIFY
jgi:hypothetical protein